MKTEAEFQNAGFTATGMARFRATVKSYSDQLFSVSVAFGEAHKNADLPREVTQDNVRKAAGSIAATYGYLDKPRSSVFLQVLEYLCTALAGAGASNLSQTWGIVLFVLGVAFAVVCFVSRSVKGKYPWK